MKQKKHNTRLIFKIICLISLLIWSISIDSIAQNISLSVDTLMHTLAMRGQFNGSILIAKKGRLVYKSGFGKADIENEIEFTPSTPCYIASLTKQLTAMAIMILAEQHELSYSDLLSKFFPEFPAYAQKVSIRNLLNHTSGIPDYTALGVERPGLTNEDVLNVLTHKDSLNFFPAEKFEYSNSNYILLAEIVEKASGQSYGSFLERYIFRPLEMNNTLVKDKIHPKILKSAKGYNRFGDNFDYDLLTYGEGGIYSTAEDLFKWDQALYTDKIVKQSKLVDAFTAAVLSNGDSTTYGFGWGLGNFNGEITAVHAGRSGGFNAFIKRFMKEKNTIIFLTNHDFKNMNSIAKALTNILYGKPYVLPKLSIAELLYNKYGSEGITSALRRYRSLKEKNDTTYDFNEPELNELGYQLIKLEKTGDAIEIFKLNAEEYPNSWNVYDSLGEAYLKNGNTELAAKNYEKSLNLNPHNEIAKKILNKIRSQ